MGKNQKFMKRLMEIRKKESLTQKEFCKKIGVTQATLSAYETGKKQPNTDTLLTIASACNCSVDWLLGLSDRPFNEIETVSDVLRLLIQLQQCVSVTLTVGESQTAMLSINDESIAEFAAEWVKMEGLLDQKLIAQDLFDFWIEKKLQNTNLPIIK